MASKIPQPLELAQCARDKLQASAREIWSSIRSFDEKNKKESNNNNNNNSEESDDSGAPQQQAAPAEHTAAMSLEKIENVLKVMFGSCTAGMPNRSATTSAEEAERAATTSVPCEKRSRSQRSRDFVTSKDMGEHVYEQLFMDDQARATRAVEGLRAKKSASSPTAKSKSPSRQFSALFGVPMASTPIGHSVPVATAAAPLTNKAIDVSSDFDFDDGISAISAHTLDDLARVHDHKASLSPNKWGPATPTTTTPSRLADNIVDDISYPLSTRSRRRGAGTPSSPKKTPVAPAPSITTPVTFSRGPSHATASSRGTRSSKDTKSTRSTQDSEFASVWRKEELKYWGNVAEKEKKSSFTMRTSKSSAKSRRRSRCGSHSTKQDVTVTTAGSSSYSNFSSQFDKQQHPHDVIHFDTKDLVGSPEIFNHSELAEI